MPLPVDWIDNVGMHENADFLNAVGAAVNENTAARPQSGPFASCPAAGVVGRLYFCTDARIVLRDNGLSWDTVHGDGEAAFILPPTAGWTTTTLGTATVAADRGGRLFTLPSSDATPRIEYRALSPTSSYTFTCCVEGSTFVTAGSTYIGIFVRDSATGNAIWWGGSADASWAYLQINYATPTVINSAAYNFRATAYITRGTPSWWRIRDNGTLRFYEYSYNGFEFATYYSHARTTGIIPNQIGWGGANYANGQTVYGRLLSWSLT